MLAVIKLFYYMFVAGVRVCRAVFIQMWYKNRIQTLYESVHSLSRWGYRAWQGRRVWLNTANHRKTPQITANQVQLTSMMPQLTSNQG